MAFRLLGRRWDDPPRTISNVDMTIAQLESLQPRAADREDASALREALGVAADVRRKLSEARADGF